MNILHQKSLRHLAQADPVLAKVIKRAKLKPLKPRRNHFQSLVSSIINQQLSGKAADTIEKRFRAVFGGRFPKPAEILKTSDVKLRACGLSFSKISYIKNLSCAVKEGRVDFGKIQKMDDEEVINQLIQIKGIGRWTAEMFLMFSLCRPNVFSHGDLGLRNGIKKLYKIDARGQYKKLKKLIELWHPYKTLASRHLWKSMEI